MICKKRPQAAVFCILLHRDIVLVHCHILVIPRIDPLAAKQVGQLGQGQRDAWGKVLAHGVLVEPLAQVACGRVGIIKAKPAYK